MTPTYNMQIITIQQYSDLDIIQLFNNSDCIKKILLPTTLTLNNTKTALFHFELYDSINEKDRLVQTIKNNTAEKGNFLVVKWTKKDSGIEKNYEINLSCQQVP